MLSDLRQSVFRRTNPRQRVVWFFDEAQDIYKSRVNREHMVDLLAMSRSFGSFFTLITQSLTSAVRDADVLNSILTNVRWLVMLRSTLRDAELLAPGLALTGRLTKPQHNPFEPAKPMTEGEELKARLKEITKLPDQEAYCWLKAVTDKAVRIRTPHVPLPYELAGVSQREFEDFIKSEQVGQGLAPSEVKQIIHERQQQLRQLIQPSIRQKAPAPSQEPPKRGQGSLVKTLEETYEKKQGKKRSYHH